MPVNHLHLVAAALTLVLLTFVVGVLMFTTRMREMRNRRISPQKVATSHGMATQLENVQAADNFRNLFETPVLFYALVAIALATRFVPPWLVLGAWLYVALRVVHSFIHCTYNTVLHRLAPFATSFLLLVAMWVIYFVDLVAANSH